MKPFTTQPETKRTVRGGGSGVAKRRGPCQTLQKPETKSTGVCNGRLGVPDETNR
jgi:hypothetical protein